MPSTTPASSLADLRRLQPPGHRLPRDIQCYQVSFIVSYLSHNLTEIIKNKSGYPRKIARITLFVSSLEFVEIISKFLEVLLPKTSENLIVKIMKILPLGIVKDDVSFKLSMDFDVRPNILVN